MNLLATLAQVDKQTFFLPQQGSNLAGDVDWAWNIILVTTTIFFVIVVGAMTIFVIKYRRRDNAGATSTVTHNTPLEIVWTLIPLVLVIMFFFVGFKGFINYDTPWSNSRIIDAQASKWAFLFTYPNGSQSNELFVELGKPVRINMHSTDVLHALYIPAFRTQRNFIPFRETFIWFIPTIETGPANPAKHDPGGFPIFCTQYCGEGHSEMISRVHVLNHDDYEKRMLELANPFRKTIDGNKKVYVPYAELGRTLWTQLGCITCHTDSGAKSTGPSWKGLWKRDHAFAAAHTMENGQPFTLKAADDDAKWAEYITASAVTPAREVVEGFGPMPTSFAAQLGGPKYSSNNEKMRAIIEFMKTLGTEPYKPSADPKAEAQLFDADNPVLFDENHNPVHPESEAGIEARQRLATQPGGAPGGSAGAPAGSAPASRPVQ